MFDLIYLGLKKIVFSAHKSFARAFLSRDVLSINMVAMYSRQKKLEQGENEQKKY